MPVLFRQLWLILRTSGLTWQGRYGIMLYLVVLGLELAVIPVQVRMVHWTNDFYSALEAFDGQEALKQVGVFWLIIGAQTALALSAEYLRKILVIRWREALTGKVLARWFSDTVYWRLQHGFNGQRIDNPDQRIAEDCRRFVEEFIRETLDLITSVTGLFSYIALLWSLSAFPLSFSLFDMDISIPRYMVWAAFIYVFLSSGLTHLLGHPLKSLGMLQQRREADFRFSLARLRENTDAVALAGGERQEIKILQDRFSGIVDNWKRLIVREFILDCFKKPYFYTVLRIPILLALPAYFAGHVKFGGLMQLASAFQRVVTTLSWFIFAYNRLAELAATIARLGGLLEAIDQNEGAHGGAEIILSEKADIAIENFSLRTPDGIELSVPKDLTFTAGQHVWLSGPSGAGKSTFLKSLAGIWPFSSGYIHIPQNTQCLFLPQEPFFPENDILVAACYPFSSDGISHDEFYACLERVGLSDLASRIRAGECPSLAGFSRGERQRLAFVRVLLSRPDWLFLDEATSAMDIETEDRILSELTQSFPSMTIIIVSHRKPKGLAELRHLDLLKE